MGATYLGTVRKVTGAKVIIELSVDIPSANPIINGRVHRLGQIGSFVRIPRWISKPLWHCRNGGCFRI
jgi:hypothetical protein